MTTIDDQPREFPSNRAGWVDRVEEAERADEGSRVDTPDRTDRTDRVGRVVVTGEGPILVEGPVDVVTADGTTVRSERGLVALCTCRRSRISPFCDTSHRDKVRAERQAPAEGGTSA